MVRAASDTTRSRASASSRPSSSAAPSCSWSRSRSVALPVTRCNASRASSSCSRARSTVPCGGSASQDAEIDRSTTASRSPPRASLRSGSSRKASSPYRSARCSQTARSSGRRRSAVARQSASSVERMPSVTDASPATCRASSRPSWAGRSSPATRRIWATVRTEWSSFTPASQIGYQVRSASAATSERPSWTSTRSRSLPGESSRRPYPPTATSATPLTSPRRSPSQRSVRSDRERRWPGPMVPGRASRALRSSAYCVESSIAVRSEGIRPPLPGSDPNHGVHGDGPDLAVADTTGLGGLDDDVHHVLGVLVVDQHLDPDLGYQVHGVLGAPVDLGVALLPAVTAGLGDRHPLDPEGLQGRLHVIELEGLDDPSDELHACTFSEFGAGAVPAPTPARGAPP